MKKILFAALAATTLLASCAKEGNETKTIEGESAKLVINVKAPALSRAQSSTVPAVTADATISNYTVFVFDDLGVLEKRQDGTTASIEITGITTKATDVYVVANAGAGTTAVPATVTSKARLEAWIGDLNVNASQTSTRWAAGTNDAAFTFNASNEATTDATLKFISARITLNIIPMADYDNSKTDGSLILKNVSVLNAGGVTKLYGSSLIPSAAELTAASYAGKKYYAGIDMTGMANAATDYSVVSFLKDDISTLDKGDFTGEYFYFYSFENNASASNEFPVIVLIEGEYDGEAIYYPVHLAAYQEFNSGSLTAGVTRGNSYDITIKLTGNASYTTGGTYPGETGGDDDPTDDPAEEAKLTVDIEISNWVPQVLVKEF